MLSSLIYSSGGVCFEPILQRDLIFLTIRKVFYKTGHDIFIIPIDADFSFVRSYFKFMR